VIVNRLSCDE